MFTTTRIAAVLAFAFGCVPAHALSLKDWLAKSKADQVRYLSNSLARLVVDVGKTDQPLAKKITSYYSEKAPGAEYPPGMNDLFARIGRLVRQAETDKSVDLSKMEFEQVVVLNTAEKFKIPIPADFQRAADPSVKPRRAVPVPALVPSPAPRPAAPADDDPIGQGGFITPPTVTVMKICVSADFAPSWENPSAGPEMDAFRNLIGAYVIDNGKAGEQYRIRDSAYGTFESGRQATPARTALPKLLVDALPNGQRCPATDRVYNVQRKPPAAPPK
ncbi:MAG: hypothetical protein ABI759_19320 [Candidatus Solibacter sp.]